MALASLTLLALLGSNPALAYGTDPIPLVLQDEVVLMETSGRAP